MLPHVSSSSSSEVWFTISGVPFIWKRVPAETRGSRTSGDRSRPLLSFESQFGRDLDGRFQCPVDRAELGKHAVHPFRRFLLLGAGLQAEPDVYAADDQDSILRLNFSGPLGRKLSGGSIDLTRLQRAS